MKFNFKIQQYQTDAVDSVVGVFKGQPYSDPVNYRRDIGKVKSTVSYSQMSFLDSMFEQQELNFTDDFDDAGFKNEVIALPDAALLANIREIQQNNNVKLSDKLINNLGRCSLDVEMETGTGKTYVYIETMYELNKHYGWSKFIVVVPSIAIREGVKKSFEITQDHFMEQYGKKVRFFVYNSSNLNQLDAFSSNSGINVMIINDFLVMLNVLFGYIFEKYPNSNLQQYKSFTVFQDEIIEALENKGISLKSLYLKMPKYSAI